MAYWKIWEQIFNAIKGQEKIFSLKMPNSTFFPIRKGGGMWLVLSDQAEILQEFFCILLELIETDPEKMRRKKFPPKVNKDRFKNHYNYLRILPADRPKIVSFFAIG